MRAAELLQGQDFAFFGGPAMAEREVCCYVPEYLDESWLTGDEGPIAAVRAVYFAGDTLTHRDFLGALMGCGFKRETVGDIYVFVILEELRQFDEKYVNHSGSEAMQLVSRVFGIPESCIVHIRCLKAGMTNKSWYFSVLDTPEAPAEYRGKDYICRIPGPGTEKLIDRFHEGEVYQAVTQLGITEELVYFNPENGYKNSRY